MDNIILKTTFETVSRNFNRRKIGIIKINVDEIENILEILYTLHATIVKAEMLYEYNAIEYTCISPLFPSISLAQHTPRYRLDINNLYERDEIELVLYKGSQYG